MRYPDVIFPPTANPIIVETYEQVTKKYPIAWYEKDELNSYVLNGYFDNFWSLVSKLHSKYGNKY